MNAGVDKVGGRCQLALDNQTAKLSISMKRVSISSCQLMLSDGLIDDKCSFQSMILNNVKFILKMYTSAFNIKSDDNKNDNKATPEELILLSQSLVEID